MTADPAPLTVDRRRRVAAYGLCRDSDGRVLLVRASARSNTPGVWSLPGGGIEHGEHPADGVVREVAEETGLTVKVTGLRNVLADITEMPWRNVALHHDRRIRQVRRFSSYGLVTDSAGRVLLTLISANYPGAGRWHLPGGGTDHGEAPTGALLRELAEETDQVGEVTGLLEVSHRHNPAALGPEGYPIDWHVVRVLYRVRVAVPTEPRVTEAAGGSTAEACWFGREEALALPLSEIATRALQILADSPRSLPPATPPDEPEVVVPTAVAPRPAERDDK